MECNTFQGFFFANKHMKYRNYHISPKYSESEKVYYGKVEGAPSIEMIEGATLDDFERIFHEAVDEFLDEKNHKKGRSGKFLVVGLAVIGLIVAMALTCPSKDAHRDAIADLLVSTFNESTDDEWAFMGNLIGEKLVKVALDGALSVDDKFLFNVGRISYDGDSAILSIGLFNHVFTISEDQLRKRIAEGETVQELLDIF